MNDQMYKQNRRVMSGEYDQDKSRQGVKISKKDKINFGSSARRSSFSVTSQTTASDNIEDDEPFCKVLTRGIIHFIFSQE